ncbi:MAG TPA: chemotaxis protein CheW [Alphaproteobacteria bacterium]|nr:chemotaxis protein CheW [Alphaproteobacteria bacterium]
MTKTTKKQARKKREAGAGRAASAGGQSEFVTIVIADQLFGIPVLTVQDVLGPQRITRIPLAPPEVAGALNLRGRIVTVIDVRRRLGLPPREAEAGSMNVVVEYGGELYSLVIDQVGEVLSLPPEDFERNPATLSVRWREVSAGIYRLKDQLMIVLDVERLLQFRRAEAA